MDNRNNKNKRKTKKAKNLDNVIKILTVACVVVAVVLVAFVAVSLKNSSDIAVVSGADAPSGALDSTAQQLPSLTQQVTTGEQATPSTQQATTQETTARDFTLSQTEEAEETQETQEAEESDSGRIIVDPEQELWNLVVVNSGREMPEGYVPQLEYVAGSEEEMDYRVAPWYDKMYYAALEDGITLTPYSGYRSYDLQKSNYESLTYTYMDEYDLSWEEAAEEAAMVILPPGTSEHNLGLAMDICNTYDSFAYQEEYEWLTQHAHEYGFILRYTEENTDITGIVDEPWHWRYVGVEYAEKIKNSGLCLEEYLDSVGIDY